MNGEGDRTMTCTVCGAGFARHRTHCVICGFARKPDDANMWDRVPEALLYEDLHASSEDDEPVLAATRGRIAGTLRAKAAFSPQRLLTPYVNLGLTGKRLIVQHVNPLTGLSVGKPIYVNLATIRSITVTDSDPIEPDRSSRLVISFTDGGETVRVRASGRMAKSAVALCEVWQAVTNKGPAKAAPAITCAECDRELSKESKFCPFCGKPRGGA